MAQVRAIPVMTNKGFIRGVGLTLVIAIAAKILSTLPLLSIMGQLVLAIVLGMLWRSTRGVGAHAGSGIAFSSTALLRSGIILLGVRLNLADIVRAGPKVLLLAVITIIFALFVVYRLARLFNVENKLGLLTACGTAICGAAAIAAISPQLKAGDDETAISAATVAILGTIFTLIYTLLYPVLGLSQAGYGVFAGATLHEIAHVIAAAAPIGKEAVDLAVIVKLTRVALLVPVAIVIGLWTHRSKNQGESEPNTPRTIPIPWFIVGFFLMSAVNSLHLIPAAFAAHMLFAAYLLIAMAMAGLGLKVDLHTFRRLGMKPFAAGLIGSILLAVLDFLLVHAFKLT
ncbi:YeiH family protein [Paenibacillus whitsoniae]|uniref:YeiH family putative sulfate export transporter n=1 Tax=Paenibacillus whitsoniae TaxID=2496558 RepID=A0A3S0IC76_9BACL|nr:YeiH family protein [Paenibacillus whitsoniae]RTE09785.1 YeiH family putative sulfate export transporter [Paenibacillus whitsoniae]